MKICTREGSMIPRVRLSDRDTGPLRKRISPVVPCSVIIK